MNDACSLCKNQKDCSDAADNVADCGDLEPVEKTDQQRVLELVDELTSTVMDIIRREFNVNDDSNQDDELYGQIHHDIKATIHHSNAGAVIQP